MEIFLVRHGIAEDASPVGGDAARQLTEEGRSQTSRIAKSFRKRVDEIHLIRHSPFLRAEQTAMIFAAEFPNVDIAAAPGLTPHDSAKAALALISGLHAKAKIMLVGHEPHLSSLASLLLTGNETPILEFKKGGIAAIECFGSLYPCQLRFLITPKWL